jgi:hypothetical protein
MKKNWKKIPELSFIIINIIFIFNKKISTEHIEKRISTIDILVYCAKVELIVGSDCSGGVGHDSNGSVSSRFSPILLFAY